MIRSTTKTTLLNILQAQSISEVFAVRCLGPWLPIISVQLESRILFRLDGVFIVSPVFIYLFLFSCFGSFLNMYDFKDQWAFGSGELIMLAWGNVCKGNIGTRIIWWLRKNVGKSNFAEQFRKLINRYIYKRIGYNPYIMRQTACLVVNHYRGWQLCFTP